jgi:hypothetical protein
VRGDERRPSHVTKRLDLDLDAGIGHVLQLTRAPRVVLR